MSKIVFFFAFKIGISQDLERKLNNAIYIQICSCVILNIAMLKQCPDQQGVWLIFLADPHLLFRRRLY